MSTDFEPGPNDTRDLRFHRVDPAAARTLTSQQVQAFNDRGYLSKLEAFSPDLIGPVRSYIDWLLHEVVAAPDPRNAYSINSYHLVCSGLYDLIQTPTILDLVEDIVGPDIVCWGLHLFAKQPHDPMSVPMHQDAVYWPLTPSKSVTAWLAIDDADAGNAAMQFVPGSHLLGALSHEMKPLDGTRVLKRQVVGVEGYGERVTNELEAGELSLHSDLLLHGSDANASNRRRAGLTIRYVSAEVDALPGYEFWKTPAVHCRGTIPDHWPHWQRPAGEHPEKMARVFGEFDGTALDAG